MDALVKAALERVNEAVINIPEPDIRKYDKVTVSLNRTKDIAKAIHAVDALKSALKTLH